MHDDERVLKLGFIMLFVVLLIMAGLGVCYKTQSAEIVKVRNGIKNTKVEIDSISLVLKEAANMENTKKMVKELNPKAEDITFKKKIDIEDIPMVE